MADYSNTPGKFAALSAQDADPSIFDAEFALVGVASVSKMDDTGGVFSGAISVPAGATGSQAPQAQEVFSAAHLAAGTRMLFAQPAAPVGWTQDVTAAVNDRMLRMVNTSGANVGAGTGIGGVDSPIATGPSITDGHPLIIEEMPAHTHTSNAGGVAITAAEGGGFFATSPGVATSPTGGGLPHTHSIPAWLPKYIDIIVCAKD